MAIPNPVPGGKVRNNFGDCRGTGCSRKHAGVDIMAPDGTPVLAPIGGTVAKLSQGGLGGNAVWVNGNDGRSYYFAHLSKIAVGVGQTLSPGTQLGNVGHTGDAQAGAPHLHFSVNDHVGAENPVVDPFTIIDSTLKFGSATDWTGRPIGGGSGVQTAAGKTVTPTTGAGSTARTCEGCLVSFPGVVGIGGGCILSSCQAQGLVGGLAMIAGGAVMLTGALVLVAYSLKGMGAKAALASVPGGSAIAGAVTPSGRAAKATQRETADVRSSELSARAASAEARRASAEERTSRVVERRTEAANRSRSRDHARRGEPLPGESYL